MTDEQIEQGVRAMLAAQGWRSRTWRDSAIGGFQYKKDGKPLYVIRDHEAEEREEQTVVIFETTDNKKFEAELSRAVMRRLLRKAVAAMTIDTWELAAKVCDQIADDSPDDIDKADASAECARHIRAEAKRVTTC